MSSVINILPDHVINKIAAGEVVERPASVVKELVENSLDAGADDILIEIRKAGTGLIRITDNGSGMSREDARNAFVRHATSKIRSDEDLEAIRTMGFRGEALASIASVSRVRLLTAVAGASSGELIEIEAGRMSAPGEVAAPRGTSIEVADLFFNTPARLKFLKSGGTEFSHILTAVSRQAMAHPGVRFKLVHNDKTILDLPASTVVLDRLFQVYGNEIASEVIPCSAVRGDVRMHGMVGVPSYNRSDRTYQEFFVNQRPVRNASLTHALYAAYEGLLMRDRHPVAFLFIDVDPSQVDVNVHPQKSEVRFRNQAQMHDFIRDVVRESLRTHSMPASTAPVVLSGGEGVRESLTAYLAGSGPAGSMPPEKRPASFYGRRRTDVDSAAIEDPAMAHTAVSATEPYVDRRAIAPLVPENELVPLAQIHNSFIVAQSGTGMVLIDQHAAHERVLFEKLQDQMSLSLVSIQNLLVPVQVELGPAQAALLAEHLVELQKLGLIIEEFGNNAFMIKAVPAMLAGADYRSLMMDILDELTNHGRSGTLDELRDEILSVMACHPAVKVHRHLSIREMETLLSDLFKCRMPHSCPHGRPTIVRFSMEEIRKMFKRT